MNGARCRRTGASALGLATALLLLAQHVLSLAALTRTVRESLMMNGTYGTVPLFGLPVTCGVSPVAPFVELFLRGVVPVLQGAFLVWIIGAWPAWHGRRLHRRLTLFLPVIALAAVNDIANHAVALGCGTASASPGDALFAALLVLHRLAPLAFLALVRRRGVARLPAAAWLLPAVYAAVTAGVAAARLAAFPAADPEPACAAVACGAALAVACVALAASAAQRAAFAGDTARDRT